MKNVKLTCCLLLVTFSLVAKSTPASLQTSNIQTGIQDAAHAQKLLIAHFVADWCMPSRWMEEHTFKHPKIHEYLKENYLPIKVDIDEADGFQDKEQYKVETLPTILIFSASGRLLERIEGITDVEVLRNYLRKHNLSIHKRAPIRPLQPTEPTSTLVDLSHLDRPAFEYSINQAKPLNATNTISTPNLPMTMEEVYGPETRVQPASTLSIPTPEEDKHIYGVEVAVLKQYSSVIKYVRTLEKRVSDKVFILLRREQGQKNYHVFIGKVRNRQAAFELRQRLSSYNIQGMVKVLYTI